MSRLFSRRYPISLHLSSGGAVMRPVVFASGGSEPQRKISPNTLALDQTSVGGGLQANPVVYKQNVLKFVRFI